MQRSSLAPLLLALAACASSGTSARESEDRTGTNPLVLRSTAELAVGYSSAGSGADRVEVAPSYRHAFAERRMRLGLVAPIRGAEAGGEGAVGLGDIALRYEWLAHDEEGQGTVLRADASFDTASEDSLGSGRTVLAPALISVLPLDEASLLALSYEQRFSVDGTADADALNRGTVAARWVTADGAFQRWWLVEPALVVDFEAEADTFGFLAAERGWVLGDVRGGALSAFVRPEVGLGGRRELDWGLSIGVRLVGL